MVVSTIFRQARETPDKIACVYNGVACRYAAFAERIARCRAFLARQALQPRCVVLIDVDDMVDAWAAGFALRSLGHMTLAVPGADDPRIPRIADAGGVVMMAGEGRAKTHRRFPSVRHVVVPGDEGDAAANDARTPACDVPPESGGNIMMTSGTTGAYKMVVRDAEAEAGALPLHAGINAIASGSVVYIANFGMWTGGGYRWPLITWSVGGTVVMHGDPDVHVPLARHEMTHIFATPNTLAQLLRAPRDALRRNDATRLLVTGGAMSQAMLAEARARVTPQVYAVLASTEALTLAVTPVENADDLLWHRIHPSREVQVVDDDGNVLPPGVEGLVRVRIIDGLEGYLDDAVATREYFRDGYFYPGDIGMFGGDGRLSMRGRASDVINLFGDKIATGPLEQSLQDRLGAEGVCIVAIESSRGRDEIYVVIKAGQPLQPSQIAAATKDELRIFRRIPIHAVLVGTLPRNAMGKIDRRALRRELAARISAGSGAST
jgi:acyl-coenzyme A synthetase/AMP-(fatty) acid ligase